MIALLLSQLMFIFRLYSFPFLHIVSPFDQFIKFIISIHRLIFHFHWQLRIFDKDSLDISNQVSNINVDIGFQSRHYFLIIDMPTEVIHFQLISF